MTAVSVVHAGGCGMVTRSGQVDTGRTSTMGAARSDPWRSVAVTPANELGSAPAGACPGVDTLKPVT